MWLHGHIRWRRTAASLAATPCLTKSSLRLPILKKSIKLKEIGADIGRKLLHEVSIDQFEQSLFWLECAINVLNFFFSRVVGAVLRIQVHISYGWLKVLKCRVSGCCH